MLKIGVEFDLSVLDKTAERYEKNLAYSVAQALNATVREVQTEIRAQLRSTFQVRKADFMDRSIKIFAFASVNKDRAFAEIGIDSKPRLLLPIFETGGTRGPFRGANTAIPVIGGPARPSFASPINPAFTFQALNFRRGPVSQAGKAVLADRRAQGIRKRKLAGQYYVWQGEQRTFILPHTDKAPNGGVFQRIGPGRDDIRLIYSFRPNVQLRKALNFVDTAQAVYERTFGEQFVSKFYRLGL